MRDDDHRPNTRNKRKRGLDAPPSSFCDDASSESGSGIASELKEMKDQMNEMVRRHGNALDLLEEVTKNHHDDVEKLTKEIAALRVENKAVKSELGTLRGQIGAFKTVLKSSNRLSDRRDKKYEKLADEFSAVSRTLRNHERLIKNQRWTYGATPIPISHWSSQWNDEYTEAADGLVREMEERTKIMMLQGCTTDEDEDEDDEERTISLGPEEHELGTDGFINYDPILRPHWTEFAKALTQYRLALDCMDDEQDTCFRIINVQLPSPVRDLLKPALDVTHFKTIKFCNNGFDRQGVRFALDILKYNLKVDEFRLEKNFIENSEDVEYLCEIIRSHPTLEMLHLVNCFRGEVDAYEALCSVMIAGRKKLKALNFEKNLGLSKERRSNFLDLLALNPCLENLDLRDNNLNEEDACLMANAVHYNKNLKGLDLTSNDISSSSSGAVAFDKLIFDTSGLNAASDSNHILEYVELGSEGESASFYQPDDYDEFTLEPKVLRKKKIYLVLSKRNKIGSNVESLCSFKVPLLPNILGCITDCYDTVCREDKERNEEDEVPALSVVYELIRGWDKALAVFERRGREEKVSEEKLDNGRKKNCSNDDGEDLTDAINSIQELSPDEYQKISNLAHLMISGI